MVLLKTEQTLNLSRLFAVHLEWFFERFSATFGA